MAYYYYYILLCFFWFTVSSQLANASSLATDRTALLQIKQTIKLDPNLKLSNWNSTTHVCNFTGVTCNIQKHHVTRLNLNNANLTGILSPAISNLSRLHRLDLTKNHLSGVIPHDFSKLKHLTHLVLEGNSLEGPIPHSFSLLTRLVLINLKENRLTGTIPKYFFSNCTLLKNVDLSLNFLHGEIPNDIGNCPNLWNLNLYNNQFIGEIPFSLTNASTMYNLDVEYNKLSGLLPSEIVANLPELNFLHLSYNKFVSHDDNTNLDPFFVALLNCSKLIEIELAGMYLGGSLPSFIGQLSINLQYLLLDENMITGSLPSGIVNLTSLLGVNMSSNLLTGSLPDEISELNLLIELVLSHNLFNGSIPSSFGNFLSLGHLDLSFNRLSGEIPRSLSGLKPLYYLYLNNNLLSGEIPPSLGLCTHLSILDLSHNELRGGIPIQLTKLQEMRIYVNLSHNLLEGSLPIELSNFKDVLDIDLSSNKLTGNIFSQISNCIALELLNLSNNSLHGELPDTLGDLVNLRIFDVSKNQLSGNIPTTLNKLQMIQSLDLSFNDFNGSIPSGGIFDTNCINCLSFQGNYHLCGKRKFQGIPICRRKKRYFRSSKFLIIFCSVLLFVVICFLFGCWKFGKNITSSLKVKVEKRKPPADPLPNFPRLTYKELSDATGGFDEQRLLGSGSYGRVYKGILPDGSQIAIKVLHVQTGNSTKSFNRECQVLKRIRHRNLIRIITACSLPDFKALVLPYMANGSLDSRLYPHHLETGLKSGSSDLNLIQRVHICSDIAEGMAYLHHHSPVRVIHCDLKPSNVLLNDDMTALVSDFGISRLLTTIGAGNVPVVENMGNSTADMLSGSIGYIAPEYAYGAITSIKGDVYSFGVLVLEMVTRKRPTDNNFGNDVSLHRWVKTNSNGGRMERVVDSSLIRALKDQSAEMKKMWEVAIGELIELGILCTLDSPSGRPTMLDAADDLDRLKRYLSGDTTNTFASSLGISSSTIGDD
ncbi:putative leucine-rich repeat receptor-like serine/threonine-protein kinase At2g24130 [Impatiens glandulifera]|uniref:putative leucine-rich repeat receptor-like serine/threonine-protein kinase At2g24130 n=1 Tax=Impatiens glandulifera TaxID=253017 RepID=UPI001FB0E0B4|nr:putative leucine-rich repeat receptor-like serine/threonine-protein kinase At2g24130 [Impatiens glandulifera]